jgi:hypothetical protein
MRFSKICGKSIIFLITVLGVYFFNFQLSSVLSASCTDECSWRDGCRFRCSGNIIQFSCCGDWDRDGCLEWNPEWRNDVDCSQWGEICKNGQCIAPSSQCSCTPWVNQGCGKGGCASNEMYQTRTCTPWKCDTHEQCVYDSSCTQPSCSCTSWVNQGCGKGGCASDQMYQTRTCSPSGCAATSRCVSDPSCNIQLSPPTGLTATCSSDGKTVVLSWNPVSGASYYSIRVDDTTQGINDDPCKGTPGDYCNETVYGTSITVPILPGDSYIWWVHARDNAGNWSDAAIGYFTCSGCSCTNWVNQGCGKGGCASDQMYQTRTCTPSGCDVASRCTYDSSCASVPAPPTGLSYTCNNDGTVTIRWNPVSGASYYSVRLDANAPSWNGSYWDSFCTDSGSWYCYDYCQNRVTGTSITLKIGYNSPYDFWIHSRSSTGQWSDASHLYFTCYKTPPYPNASS